MRILPAEIKQEVEELIEARAISLDLYDVLGQCTWGQNRLLVTGDRETINTVA